MRRVGCVVLALLALGCGARHAPPEPLPAVTIEIAVEQAIIADSDLLLVGMTIGTESPAGVIVDQVDASASLQGVDLGELALVPMMEARMPPWTLMLMWRIPEGSELHPQNSSSVTGTVSWKGTGEQLHRTTFQLPIEIENPTPMGGQQINAPEETSVEEDSASEGSP
jgi:hypothetical protein